MLVNIAVLDAQRIQLLEDTLACGKISRSGRPGAVNVLQDEADDPALLGEMAQKPGGGAAARSEPSIHR